MAITIINTITLENYIELIKMLIDQGMVWSGDNSKRIHERSWYRYGSSTCVIFRETKTLTYCDVGFAHIQYRGIKITDSEEYMKSLRVNYFKKKYDLR